MMEGVFQENAYQGFIFTKWVACAIYNKPYQDYIFQWNSSELESAIIT